jgi:hypothetical protein
LEMEVTVQAVHTMLPAAAAAAAITVAAAAAALHPEVVLAAAAAAADRPSLVLCQVHSQAQMLDQGMV